jgi:hypothetical protein
MWLSDICKNKYANAKVLSSRFLMKISPFTDCVIYQDLPIVLFTAVIQLISKTGYTWTEGIATHFIFKINK